MFYTFYG